MKVYIAAPFFNPTQLDIVEKIKATLKVHDIEYFSPKDESMFKQGDDPINILQLNCNAIDACDALVAVTDDKDVGTMFECGYAYANNIPIVYIWLGRKPGMKFNLMLAASGSFVHTIEEIPEALYDETQNYTGLIE
jgi:nucleoside deoxyribosyltransferase